MFNNNIRKPYKKVAIISTQIKRRKSFSQSHTFQFNSMWFVNRIRSNPKVKVDPKSHFCWEFRMRYISVHK